MIGKFNHGENSHFTLERVHRVGQVIFHGASPPAL
jgi:hypothetical protein